LRADTGGHIGRKPNFDPFYDEKTGTGLGLDNTEIIGTRGAEVRSEPGKGSAFTVFIPLKK
jgi:signal transduction histidine kinase